MPNGLRLATQLEGFIDFYTYVFKVCTGWESSEIIKTHEVLNLWGQFNFHIQLKSGKY